MATKPNGESTKSIPEEDVQKVRQRIVDVLTVYPGVAIGMLHSRIRPYHTRWREIFEDMVDEGAIKRESTSYDGRIHYKYYLVEDHPLIKESG